MPELRPRMRALVLLLASTACATAAKQPAPSSAGPAKTAAQFEPWAPPAGGDGTSLEAAVVVPAQFEEDGVRWERDWIFDHYGRFRKKSVGITASAGRHYDVFTFELPDGSEKTVIFDITNFFGREKGQ